MTQHEAARWRRRFLASRISVPEWADDAPGRAMYATNASGKWELSAWDLRTNAHRQITDRPEGTLNGTIDPSGEQIWWFDDERGSEHGQWMITRFDVDLGRALLAQPATELPPAFSAGLALGRRFVVIGSADDDGVRLDVQPSTSTASTRLYEHDEDASLGDLSRDEDLIAFHHSEHGDSRNPAVRVVRLDGTTVAEQWDGADRGLWVMGFSPVIGDRRLLLAHDRHEMMSVLVWDLDRGDERDIAHGLPGEVTADWYLDGSALLLHHDHAGRAELYRYDLDPVVHTPLTRLPTPIGSVTGATPRPDGSVWYGWTSSQSPSQVRVLTSDGVDERLLAPPGDAAPEGVAYVSVQIEAADPPRSVPAFVAEPADRPRPHPTLFMVHGGPEANDEDAFSARVQAWVDHGFAVVLVNYRGSSGYGRQWRDALVGNPGLTELDDLAAVHDWVLRSGLADPARIVLEGGSWGGYLTLLGLGRQPERWSLGIAEVPVADYVAAYEDEMEPLKAYDRALFGGAPEEIPEVYRLRSPLTYVEQVRVPVLVMAGENDQRCPLRQIENYLARLVELGLTHEVYRYDAGHGSLVIDETIKQVAKAIDFVHRHLGTDAVQ